MHRIAAFVFFASLMACGGRQRPDGASEEAAFATIGGGHTCAVMTDGTMRCWGRGEFGQLGYGDRLSLGDDELAGAGGLVSVPGKVVSADAGEDHTCAVSDRGQVRCWGRNLRGQLGRGGRDNMGDDETVSEMSSISLGERAIAVAAGFAHSCAVTEQGNLFCWGANEAGQLGYGDTADYGLLPGERPDARGPVPLGARAIGVAAGAKHTCALLEGGDVLCWGRGESGQTGRGDGLSWGDTPQRLPATGKRVSLGGPAVAITAGDLHTCALMADGSARCWGYGWDGRLGTGSTHNIGDDETVSSVQPIRFATAITSLSAGSQHTCLTTAAGEVSCFGRGSSGQLGRGDAEDAGAEFAAGAMATINLGPKLPARSVAAGPRWSCAVFGTSLRCWGENGLSNQLGSSKAGMENWGDDPGELPAAVEFSAPTDEAR
jgi:alpha-tubulin suppressor-like RCC1 family protein